MANDDVEARLLAAEKRAWSARRRAEHGDEVVDRVERLMELLEDGDLEGAWQYVDKLVQRKESLEQQLEGPSGPVH